MPVDPIWCLSENGKRYISAVGLMTFFFFNKPMNSEEEKNNYNRGLNRLKESNQKLKTQGQLQQSNRDIINHIENSFLDEPEKYSVLLLLLEVD